MDEQKPQYKVAVEEFEEAERRYREIEEQFNNGSFLPEGRLKQDFMTMLESLKSSLEDRNAKLQIAATSVRELVKLPESQWRGPDGKADVQKVGPFTVTSTTYRSFDPETLIARVKQAGLWDRVSQLTGYDKQNKEFKLLQQEWKVDYDGLKSWLLQNGFKDIVTAAYDEKEGTPRVSGAKPLAFLGDVIKS